MGSQLIHNPLAFLGLCAPIRSQIDMCNHMKASPRWGSSWSSRAAGVFCARVFWQNQSWLAHSQRRNPSSIIIGYNKDNTANKKKRDERTAKKCIFLADNVWVTADRVFFRCIHNKKGSENTENTGLSACSDIYFYQSIWWNSTFSTCIHHHGTLTLNRKLI